MSLSPRFIEYFRENFFQENEEELGNFLKALETSIPRTIRIKPGKEHEVKERLESYGFLLGDTSIPNVFTLGRDEEFNPLERRIGYSVDHLVGNFYIQELAAATSVHILSDGLIHHDAFVILDMAASPGGKTTQLAEQYPESFIIANEPTRERIPQLLQNLDRMGSANIGVTLYPGQYFRHTPETFDRVLLDAPCSGEGTLYKGTEATKHWHIKNIKTIARLQEKLIESALIALKVGGEMVYSTCSMNLLENEGVLASIETKYPGTFEILSQKRFWPHIDHTGGFFVAKIRKLLSTPLEEKSRENMLHHTNEELRTYKSHLGSYTPNQDITLYEHQSKVLAVRKHRELENLRKKYYFMRWGDPIGMIERGGFVPNTRIGAHINTSTIEKLDLPDEETLDIYLRGGILDWGHPPGEVLLSYQGVMIGRELISEDGKMSNSFPADWRRK